MYTFHGAGPYSSIRDLIMVESGRRVLFAATRMHTNELGHIQFFQEEGYTVEFFVNKVGPIEDHRFLGPQIFLNTSLSDWLTKLPFLRSTDCEFCFPRIKALKVAIAGKKFDFVFIKNPAKVFSLSLAHVLRKSGAKIIFYSQTDFDNWCWVKKKIGIILLIYFDALWISPLRSSSTSSTTRRFGYLPFVVPKDIAVPFPIREQVKILMVGKYRSDRKKHKEFLEVCNRLFQAYIFKVTLVGEDSCVDSARKVSDLRKYVIKTGHEEKIKIVTNVAHSDMREIYKSHDIFVLPAENEPAAISPIEAMVNGVVPICSDTCGTKSYVDLISSKLVFPSGDMSSLEQLLAYLLKNRSDLLALKSKSLAVGEVASQSSYRSEFRKIVDRVWGI